VQERAFEPFFTTKAPGKGSGLGLSMVYGFVKQSDGHIEIESRPNIGTTVRIYLPIHAGAQPADAGQALPPPLGGRELVLIVEDNPDLRGYAVNTVRSFGYRALSAPCARSAMKLIDTRPDIALLFTDIVFRDGPTGIQLADMAHSKRPELPVLLTSGYLGDRVVQERIGLPNTFTIAKPFRAPELGRKLAEILRIPGTESAAK
jgi:CheY-like chemotaxis protein